jgi:selenocysteine-specific elongation factor
LLQALERRGPTPARDLLSASGLGEAAPSALDHLLHEGQAILLSAQADDQELSTSNQLVAAHAWWATLVDRLRRALSAYHERFRLQAGMSREALRSRLRLEAKVFSAIMALAAAEGIIADEGAIVRLPSHTVRLDPEQQRQAEALLARFRRQPYTTPSVKESVAAVTQDVLNVLTARGDLVQVSPDVLFLPETYREMAARIREALEQGGSITLAQARDMFGTSRKYAQALLEHLDETGVTKRVGDERILRNA